MGPVAVGLAGPRLLSEEEEETEPLRAETALVAAPAVPEDTHCDCLHAARVACRDDLSGKAPSKYHQHPTTPMLTTKTQPTTREIEYHTNCVCVYECMKRLSQRLTTHYLSDVWASAISAAGT